KKRCSRERTGDRVEFREALVFVRVDANAHRAHDQQCERVEDLPPKKKSETGAPQPWARRCQPCGQARDSCKDVVERGCPSRVTAQSRALRRRRRVGNGGGWGDRVNADPSRGDGACLHPIPPTLASRHLGGSIWKRRASNNDTPV